MTKPEPARQPVARAERATHPAGTALVWKNSGRLADGREIIYFDEAPGLGREEVPDSRDLGPRPDREQPDGDPADGDPADGAARDAEQALRWDPLTGEWVIVAAARQDRTFLPPADSCPLCPSRPGSPTEIPAPDYDVVVFENRFPALVGADVPRPARCRPARCRPARCRPPRSLSAGCSALRGSALGPPARLRAL